MHLCKYWIPRWRDENSSAETSEVVVGKIRFQSSILSSSHSSANFDGIGMTSADSRSVASSEISTCFQTWTNAWNEGNIVGYLDGYADSPLTRYVSGKKVINGKDNIIKMFEERGARGNLSLVHFESDCISEHDAICFGQYKLVECAVKEDDRGRIKDVNTGEEHMYEGCFTVHVRKLQNTWKIISDHSS